MSEIATARDVRWEALRRRICALQSLLQDQGTLVSKRRGGRQYWYLRYYETVDGTYKQRSLYVGGEPDARRVMALLRETLRLVQIARRLVQPLLQHRRRGDAGIPRGG